MRVLVTGGTGFVGGHTVAAFRRAGHDVRVLARRPEKVHLTLGPLGAGVEDVAVGDVLDEAAVLRALQGMEAVVHAAAVYTTDPRHHDEVRRTNALATRTVLGQAVRAGMDPVVHVSSVAALARHGPSGPEMPLGDMTHPYAKSKIQSEALARELQDEGHPGGHRAHPPGHPPGRPPCAHRVRIEPPPAGSSTRVGCGPGRCRRWRSQPQCMHGACDYAACMANVQIRNVPEDLHRRLRARAALEGSTVSGLLLRELERFMERPSKKEVLARIASRAPVEPAETSAEAVRAGRDAS